MLLHNTYLRSIMLGLLMYSMLTLYVFASNQNAFATALRLDRKPIATQQTPDKVLPALCVQVDHAFCTPYNPLQLKEPELFKSMSDSIIEIYGLDWVTATISTMYLVPANTLPASSTCASVSTLETSTVLRIAIQTEGNTGFSAIIPLPAKLEVGKLYNVCATGIGSDQQALDNNKTVLLFQIKTLNNTVVSQPHRSAAQSDTTPLGLLSTLALLLAVAAILLYIFVSIPLNTNIQNRLSTLSSVKKPKIGSDVAEQNTEHPEEI